MGGQLAWSGCAHSPAATPRTEQTVDRKLLVLETDFSEFVAKRLHRDIDGRRASVVESLAQVEMQTARLESLRLRYLDVIEQGVTHRQRLIAMVRISEIHLDLASRIRRLPYPPDATRAEQRGWDRDLSRLALPLEAVGLGVLEQVDEYAEHRGLQGRFIRRARVYLALHTSRTLVKRDLAALQVELRSRGLYGPPQRLLSAGRIGQRAARR